MGTGRVCASFDLRSAAWLSVGTPHERHGFVELSALPPFDEAERGEPAATRNHRLRMTQGQYAFLAVEVRGRRPRMAADTADPQAPAWSARGVRARAEPIPDSSIIRQRWEIRSRSHPQVRLVLDGGLDRPALAEITETNPPMPTGTRTIRGADGPVAWLEAASLPERATIAVRAASVEWVVDASRLIGLVSWPPSSDRLEFTVEVSLGAQRQGTAHISPTSSYGADADALTARALAYVRGCTALATGEYERAILTDHRILPLSWTRDAYWQALALLAADEPGDRRRVADHLRWLWRRCERPDGRWVRSHHANGRRKDMAFQADQQLYPLIELADYWRVEGTLPAGVLWTTEVERAWEAALEEVDPELGLIGSTENAADDAAALPFIGSSQIVLWYAALRLAELAEAGAVALDRDELLATAGDVRRAFDMHFVADGEAWPYSVDGQGARLAYHDANDLPSALAPLWGFCAPDDPGWRATMEFAFSQDNAGWVPGRRAGLGSRHTPGQWTLGDIQAWLKARVVGDADAAENALERLREVAFLDGMLPETYGTDGGAGRIRHWFAWPGAALAALRILDSNRLLEERLSATSTAAYRLP